LRLQPKKMADIRQFEAEYRQLAGSLTGLVSKVADSAASFSKVETEARLVEKMNTTAKIMACLQAETEGHIRALRAAAGAVRPVSLCLSLPFRIGGQIGFVVLIRRCVSFDPDRCG
jgi:hypothetical protein